MFERKKPVGDDDAMKAKYFAMVSKYIFKQFIAVSVSELVIREASIRVYQQGGGDVTRGYGGRQAVTALCNQCLGNHVYLMHVEVLMLEQVL